MMNRIKTVLRRWWESVMQTATSESPPRCHRYDWPGAATLVSRRTGRWVTASCCILLLLIAQASLADSPEGAETDDAQVLIVCGPSSHPPGTHEVAAGARLLKYCLENPTNAAPINTQLRSTWPEDKSLLASVSSVVFIGDLFPPERLDNPKKIKAELADMMRDGCGMVCVHYATGLREQHVGDKGEHPLLDWLGGYFASRCPHHRSVARVVKTTIVPARNDHPVLRGWKRFTFKDEPYWNNYFGNDGPGENVTALAYALVPPDQPRQETVVWAIEREDDGRGVGVVMPHYYRNWKLDDLRTMVLNGIFWSARLEVPEDGVKTTLPELKTFAPDAVAP